MTHILLDCTIKGSHFLRETAKWDCFQELRRFFTTGMIYRADVLHVNANWKKKKKERKICTKIN